MTMPEILVQFDVYFYMYLRLKNILFLIAVHMHTNPHTNIFIGILVGN